MNMCGYNLHAFEKASVTFLCNIDLSRECSLAHQLCCSHHKRVEIGLLECTDLFLLRSLVDERIIKICLEFCMSTNVKQL